MARRRVPAFDDLDPFVAGDFELFAPARRRDSGFDGARLRLKRKLHAAGEWLRARLAAAGEDLRVGTSLHRPYVLNGNQVSRMALFLSPGPKVKRALGRLLGVEFREETDAAYAHTNLLVQIDFEGVLVGLRVHERAWWDTQNVKGRCADRAGMEAFADLLNRLPPDFALRMHDWKKRYVCGSLRWDDLLEYFRAFKPAEHRLEVSRFLPRGDERLLTRDFFEEAARDFERLLPIYRFVTWTPENDHLRLGRGS